MKALYFVNGKRVESFGPLSIENPAWELRLPLPNNFSALLMAEFPFFDDGIRIPCAVFERTKINKIDGEDTVFYNLKRIE